MGEVVEKFSFRKYAPASDFSLIKKWGENRGMQIGAPEFLPPTGIVVAYYSKPVCMGFMIRCDNGVAINSDFMSDPDVPKDLRNEAVEFMREKLYGLAKTQGFRVVIAFTSIPKHAERLKNKGYIEMDKNLVHLGRIL